MKKFFNNAGPTVPEKHYHISSFLRIDWAEIQMYIQTERYFLLHAPRQTGKTTALLEIMARLNHEADYLCVYANIEGAQAARHDVKSAIPAICNAIARSVDLYVHDKTLQQWLIKQRNHFSEHDLLTEMLKQWAIQSAKPTILFIDEIDALVGDTLISVLRQVRAGYGQRPEAFPQSIVLCGLRDVRDYRIHTKDKEIITGGSAFNIKAKSIRMGNFSFEECKNLYLQHSTETGQEIAEDIYPALWEDTKGQPWLVNALGWQLTWEDKTLRDGKAKITLEHYHAAREELIRSRTTHLDQLVDKLKEPRINHVISPILANSENELSKVTPGDIEYVIDLGLITRGRGGKLAIANKIYQETIPRELTWATQSMISNQEQHWYVSDTNQLDMNKLLQAFQKFFRQHADSWIEQFDYKEAGPQLLLQAFLQRIINGGGRIDREYALGRKRTDIYIRWPTDKEKQFFGTPDSIQKIIIETKILYSNLEKTIEKGIEQTREYASFVGAKEQHLIIFNRNGETSWDEKIWHKVMDGLDVWGA